MPLRTLWKCLALPLLLAFTAATAPHAQIFSNPTPIAISTGAAGPANPYPSAIAVSGVGTVTDVNVTISGFSHTYTNDVDILLVGPDGTRLVLMSDHGGSTTSTNLTLVFDDQATRALTTTALSSGSYRPGNNGAGDVFPAPAPTTGTLATTLAAYNGLPANGTWSLYVADDANGDGGQIAGGWSINFNNTAVPPAFTFSPTGLDFGAAGACIGFTRTATLSLSNPGGGTINVTSVTVTGDPAFAIGASAPSFPIAITSTTGTVAIPLVFAPTSSVTGPQNGTVTIAYTVNGGAAQTATIPLSGAADAEGAGFVFRSNDADPSCLNGAGAPAGTGFVDIATHTRVTTYAGTGTGDDGFVALDLAALGFGSVRLFGQNWTTIYPNTNGSVFLEFGLANFYGGLPVGGATTLQVGAMDLSFGTATTDYDTPDPGQYPVGLYYGLSDVDGDGTQEFVITWFHAYDFFSDVYTGPTPHYFTSQLILFKALRGNEEDTVEMRFPDGVDGAGIPFRRNTAGAFIEDDVVVGVGEPAGAEAALFRVNGFGAPLYSGGTASRAVRFEAEIQSIARGRAGWRMMGSPLRNFTVGRLASLNLVQSVTGQYPSFPFDNVYLDYDGAAYVPATDVANVIDPGQGFLWYLFNQNLIPGTTNPEGTSRSYELPMDLEATGAEPALTNGTVPVPLITAGNKFNLVANPYRDDLDVSGLASWATGGTLMSAVPQVWDPNMGSTGGQTGSYVTVSGSVSTWQGFFIENNTATGLNIPTNARNRTGNFIGRSGAVASTATSDRVLGFQLDGVTPDGDPTTDVAATLVFAEDAVLGWDLLDASKLAPLTSAYATAAFVGERDGEVRAQAQASLPFDATPAQYAVPVVISAVGTTPAMTLSWPRMENLPDGWQLELRDLLTGDVVDLRTATSYAFTVAPAAPRTGGPETWLAETIPAGQAPARTAARFEVVVTTGNLVAGSQDVPTVFALERVAPNPAASAASVRFAMPEAGAVSLALYDLLGRQVAVLASGEQTAGWHTATLDASRLSAGVYVVRMQAGTFAATQRVTVVR